MAGVKLVLLFLLAFALLSAATIPKPSESIEDVYRIKHKDQAYIELETVTRYRWGDYFENNTNYLSLRLAGYSRINESSYGLKFIQTYYAENSVDVESFYIVWHFDRHPYIYCDFGDWDLYIFPFYDNNRHYAYVLATINTIKKYYAISVEYKIYDSEWHVGNKTYEVTVIEAYSETFYWKSVLAKNIGVVLYFKYIKSNTIGYGFKITKINLEEGIRSIGLYDKFVICLSIAAFVITAIIAYKFIRWIRLIRRL